MAGRKPPQASNRGPDGSFQVRLLIPRIASGVMIGKGGVIIKAMIERSQCKIQLGEEADPFNTNERPLVFNASSIQALIAVKKKLYVFHT